MLPPFDGFVGGNYSPTFSNTSNYPYARLLNDQGGQFAQLLWYDRMGRVILTQNTKQREYKRIAYSYSLYDALGRVIEVGKKTENIDTANNFNKIFGDTIMGFYNPNVISPSKFLAWIKDNTGPRTEVSHNYYDVQDILPTKVITQQEIRNRIATATYADTLWSDSTKYDNATHYSYDVHGNVKTLIQDDSIPNIAGQRYKRTDYQFDLISNKINEVDYQSGCIDQYHTVYQFDAENRVTQVQTSKDSSLWDNDANYFYYAHGPLARVEMGDQQVQGMDYAYTLQGWFKGVNSDLLDSNRDMGHDGFQASGNLNRYFARDAMGYTLKYFKGQVTAGIFGDYDAIDKNAWNNYVSRFEAYDYRSDLMSSRHDIFNGDITAMVTDIQKPTEYTSNTIQPTPLPQGTAFIYDQLDRLVDVKAYQNLDTDNIWEHGSTYRGLYHNWLSYDANGNIQTQKRGDQFGNVLDSLSYDYNVQGGRTLQNRLYNVNNNVNITGSMPNNGTFNSTQSTINQTNNYRYTVLGELAKDISGEIDTIIWTNSGKIWKLKKHNGDSLICSYDVSGNRVMEEYKPLTGDAVNTYYVYNPKGHIIAIYLKQIIGHTMSFTLSERDILGSGNKLGSENTPIQLIGAVSSLQIDTDNRYLGFKQYELVNHIGNILCVVSDRKIPRPDNPTTPTRVEHYEADVSSTNDYYAYGMFMLGRTFFSAKDRFGYQNSLKEDSVYGKGNLYFTKFRDLDTRLGRWLSQDPKKELNQNLSPYVSMKNNPISIIDLLGDVFQAANDKASQQDVQSVVQPENQKYLKFDEKGIVSLDFGKMSKEDVSDLLSKDKGLDLINNLVNAKDDKGKDMVFFYECGDKSTGVARQDAPDAGIKKGQAIQLNYGKDENNNQSYEIVNLSVTPRNVNGGLGTADAAPPNDYAGYVRIAPGTFYLTKDESTAENRASTVYHELMENYARTVLKMPYIDPNSVNSNAKGAGAYTNPKTGVPYGGAHNHAVQMEGNTYGNPNPGSADHFIHESRPAPTQKK